MSSRRNRTLLAAVAAAAVASLAAASPSPALAGGRPFAATSVWNKPLPRRAAPAPRSRALVAGLAREVRRETAARTGPWINTTTWSVPVYVVGAAAARVRVQLDTTKPALQRDLDAVPIPPAARASDDRDQTLVVYQPATDSLWDLYHAHRLSGVWHARWGGKLTGVSSNPGFFPAPFGASASGLPLLGGLVRIGELEAGRIDHALAMAVPMTAIGRFTWPAQRGDGRSTAADAIPEGTRFRIDPRLNLTKLRLSPVALTMARAAQRYGIIVRDGANNVAFYAEDPVTTGSNPYPRLFGGRYANEVLRGFPWRRLQVVAPPR